MSNNLQVQNFNKKCIFNFSYNKDNNERNFGLGELGIQSNIGGKSSDDFYNKYSKFYNQPMMDVSIPGVTIVRSKQQALHVLKILKSLKNRIHAWDTETIDLDIKNETAVGNGKIICATAFCGPDVDFGNGPRLVIDNFAQNKDLILIFKEYFENEKYKKIFHHIGFDRHIFYNHGINVLGIKADTLHMMRLLDPSKGHGEYSLSKISAEFEIDIKNAKQDLINNLEKHYQQFDKFQKQFQTDYIENGCSFEKIKDIKAYFSESKFEQLKQLEQQGKKDDIIRAIQVLIDQNNSQYEGLKQYKKHLLNKDIKISMKDIFGQKKRLKNGNEGLIYEYPSTLRMHTDEKYVEKWVEYSSLDAEITYFVYGVLQKYLMEEPIEFEGMKNQFELYNRYWNPFGVLLTDIERNGFKVDRKHLEEAKLKATEDLKELEEAFLKWVVKYRPGLQDFNISSMAQLQQLFFAPFTKKKNVDNQSQKTQDAEERMPDGRKKSVRTEKNELKKVEIFKVKKVNHERSTEEKTFYRHIDMEIEGFGWKPDDLNLSGMPSVDTPNLKKFVGKDPENGKFGTLMQQYMDDVKDKLQDKLEKVQDEDKKKEIEKEMEKEKKLKEEEAKEASIAINNLIKHRTIDTLKSTFIEPLIESLDKDDRVHCSININTETGRLSCKKPNLQNQPALDKDIYKIRQAFIPSPGNKLIVADYGQIELRILAHTTGDISMIDAFEKGGDFHSRTAIGMFENIREDLEKGGVLLEWDKSQGEAPAPLIKDKYANERKKAKTMNFSIAYGKTAFGFSKEWGTELEETNQIINLWYQDRKQVKEWQDQKKLESLRTQRATTLMGRHRRLQRFYVFDQNGKLNKRMLSQAERIAINSPIQGGAADVVIACMVKVNENKRLKELGWKMLLQIHDEIIMEGPKESADEALQLVIDCMQNPFNQQLKVKLEVDAKLGDSWYECK